LIPVASVASSARCAHAKSDGRRTLK